MGNGQSAEPRVPESHAPGNAIDFLARMSAKGINKKNTKFGMPKENPAAYNAATRRESLEKYKADKENINKKADKKAADKVANAEKEAAATIANAEKEAAATIANANKNADNIGRRGSSRRRSRSRGRAGMPVFGLMPVEMANVFLFGDCCASESESGSDAPGSDSGSDAKSEQQTSYSTRNASPHRRGRQQKGKRGKRDKKKYNWLVPIAVFALTTVTAGMINTLVPERETPRIESEAMRYAVLTLFVGMCTFGAYTDPDTPTVYAYNAAKILAFLLVIAVVVIILCAQGDSAATCEFVSQQNDFLGETCVRFLGNETREQKKARLAAVAAEKKARLDAEAAEIKARLDAEKQATLDAKKKATRDADKPHAEQAGAKCVNRLTTVRHVAGYMAQIDELYFNGEAHRLSWSFLCGLMSETGQVAVQSVYQCACSANKELGKGSIGDVLETTNIQKRFAMSELFRAFGLDHISTHLLSKKHQRAVGYSGIPIDIELNQKSIRLSIPYGEPDLLKLIDLLQNHTGMTQVTDAEKAALTHFVKNGLNADSTKIEEQATVTIAKRLISALVGHVRYDSSVERILRGERPDQSGLDATTKTAFDAIADFFKREKRQRILSEEEKYLLRENFNRTYGQYETGAKVTAAFGKTHKRRTEEEKKERRKQRESEKAQGR